MSGPIETFYLMFKSNAQQAKKDVTDMGDAVDKAEQKIKKTKRETSELGNAFTDAVENGLRALAAYGSFQAMKTGMVNAQQFNRELTIQSKLWGQNANEINAWGKAVKQAGGDQQAFLGWYQGVRQAQARIGRGAMAPNELMRHINQQVQGQSPAMQQMIFDKYGISDIGIQSILASTPQELEKTITAMEDLTKNTEAGAKASQEFGQSLDNLGTSLEKFWTTINTESLPKISGAIDNMTEFFNKVADNSDDANNALIAMGTGALLVTAFIPSIVLGFKAVATAAFALAPLIAGLGAAIMSIAYHKEIAAAIDEAGWNPFSSAEDYEMERRAKFRYGVMNAANKPGTATTGGGSAMDYLMNKHGLSRHQAAAVAANIQHESGGDINARGDGGKAHGLFQWHPDRRAKIFDGTGIDVSNASMEQQLDAMIWELKQRGEYEGFVAQPDAYSAGAYFSKKFERPAGGLAEAMRRGRTAMDIAGSTPFASTSGGGVSGGNNINIGKIDVNTQATDAAGIARDLQGELQKQISGVQAQYNDAVAY